MAPRRIWTLLPLLVGLLPELIVSAQQDLHVVWYISPNGSTNASSCGRAPDNPCASLELLLSQSELFSIEGGHVSSSGDTDGRLSTTVYFMEGESFVPSTRLRGWSNLRIVGLGRVTLNSHVVGLKNFFEFHNCSNVTIEGINFASVFIGRAVLYVQDSRDVTVTDCTIPVTSRAARGIQLMNSTGSVNITNTLFFGDIDLEARDNPAIGLLVTQGERPSLGTASSDNEDSYIQAEFLVQNCTFRDIADGARSGTGYTSTSRNAVGVLVQLYSEAQDNLITFQDCIFTNLIHASGSGVLVQFDGNAIGNTARFMNSIFTNNTVLYGGGVAVYFISSTDNLVEIEECEFTNNKATFEGGGVHIVSLSPQPTDFVHLRNCTFRENEADYGVGLFLFNDPSWSSSAPLPNSTSLPLMNVQVEDCVFVNCSAYVSEGIVNSLRIRMSMKGNK